jgi:SpoVK/Ycf46/Vps4 family AAA+-type ATPase
MFHGISGTGKSLSGEALAGTLGCDILTTDISKILSVWVGESEANVSRLFDRYESIARRSDSLPLLIIDECDQLLGKRFPNPERATDKMVNGMQSLLLERMGRFNKGLMILTTNLVDDGAFDPAYNRRIHKKIRFPHPDVHARIALWSLHLKNVPLDDDVDIERLARAELTGGQIRIIIENASLTCVVRHKRERLTMGDLLQALRDEQENCISAGAPVGSRPVGFCVEPELRAKEPVRSGRA